MLTRDAGNVGLRVWSLGYEVARLCCCLRLIQPVLAMSLIGFRSCKIHALNTVQHYSGLRHSNARSMHRKIAIDTSPPSARWMKDTLVRSAFHRTIPVVAARLPAAKTGPVLKSEAMRG